jgi:ankyrin repeat protein
MTTLGLLLSGALCADRLEAQTCNATSPCVPVTVNVNVQLTKLHPAVTQMHVQCTLDYLTGGNRGSIIGTTSVQPIVNRGYAGSLSTVINFPEAEIEANRTVNVTCITLFHIAANNGQSGVATATATQPQSITASNWRVVGSGSAVSWSQAVTFPNLAP